MATRKKTNSAPEPEVKDETTAPAPEDAVPETTPPAPEAVSEFPYLVEVIPPAMIVRAGPGETFSVTMTVRKGGIYTIDAEESGWGRLANGAGWMKLTRVRKVEAA